MKYFFSNGSASVGLVQGGKVKAIAHTGKGRLGTLPDLPAVQDTIPGFEAYEWNGVFVPTGTPADIIKKLNAGLNEVLKDPAVIERLTSSTSITGPTRRTNSAPSSPPRWSGGAAS